MVKTQDPIPANPEDFDRLKNNIGYSILVRMGYKPGLGLGMNLEGVTSPVRACARFQKFPAGLGASRVWDGSSKDAQCTAEDSKTTIKPLSIPTTTTTTMKPVHEISPSLPRGKNIHSRGSSNHEPPPASLPKSASSNSLAVSSNVGSTFPSGPTPVHDDSKRNVDTTTTKTPSSTLTTHPLDTFRTPGVPRRPPKKLPPSVLSLIPSSVPLRLPFPPDGSHVNVPVNPPLNSVGVNSRSIHPVPLPKSPPTSGIPYLPKFRGTIGMPPDEKGAAGRGSFHKQLEPPPDFSRSLVMEILPRKFRKREFVVEWLSQFTFWPSRYELVEGRIFIEFETERDALLAWNSPRMGGNEGLHGIRLFWYTATTPPASMQLGSSKEVNATKTITNPIQPQSVLNSPRDLASKGRFESQAVTPAPHSPRHQYNLRSLHRQPSPPSPNVEVQVQESGSVVTSPTKAKPSSSNTKMSFGTLFPDHLSGNSSVPSPSITTGPWVNPTTSSAFLNGRLAPDNPATRDEPSGGATGFAPGASVSPTFVSFSTSPTSSSTLASSSSSISPSLVPSLSSNTSDSWRKSTVLDDKALSMLSDRELMQESQLPMETSYSETGVEQAVLTAADGIRPFANGPMKSTGSVALAKEFALRQMVLHSRKRKVVATGDTQQPTSDPSAAASRSALEELAVNFISDAISRPPPAKRVKITPSASALADWGKRLEVHIEKSKVIMAEIQGTQSKAERDRLWAVLREHNRMIDEEKTALFSVSAAEVAIPTSPWPENHPDGGVLVLSDTDGGDDDDDDDME